VVEIAFAVDDSPKHVPAKAVVRHALLIVALLVGVDLVAGLVGACVFFGFQRPTYDGGSMAFSPGGESITVTSGGTLKVWDAATGRELSNKIITGAPCSLSPDGKCLLGLEHRAAEKFVHFVWETSTGKRLFTFESRNGNPGLLHPDVAFSPDGKWLAYLNSQAGEDLLEVRNVPIGNRVARIKIPDIRMLRRHLHGPEGPPQGYGIWRFSPDGKRIAMISWSGNNTFVTLWDPSNGKLAATFLNPQRDIYFMAFSTDSSRVATVTARGQPAQLQVWDATTAKELESFACPDAISKVIFTPDGVLVEAFSNTQAIRVWDPRRRQWLFEPSTEIAYSPNGARIAARAAGERTAKIWDTTTGQHLVTLKGQVDTSSRGAFLFSPDGTRLARWENDSDDRSNVKVFVWDTGTGRQLLAFNAYSLPVSQFFLSFGALAVVSACGLFCLWRCRPR
jgi:WD40 repeat protein